MYEGVCNNNNKLILMTKMFNFTGNDVDVDDCNCDRENNQDHTIKHLNYDIFI